MPTVITTPKGATSNSYISVADADTYFDERPNATTWTALTTTQKETGVISATRWLDYMFDFDGSITDQDQNLRWPRSGLVTDDDRLVDPDTIPTFLEHATAELAMALLARDRIVEPDLLGLGMSEAKLGSLAAKIDKSMVLQFIPQHIVAMLEPYGSLKAESSRGDRVVRLWRA